MGIVTLEDAKAHLRVDHDLDDADINFKLEQASAIVVDYLKMPEGSWDIGGSGISGSSGGSSGGGLAPFQVKAAVLLVLGDLYKNREGEENKNEQALGYLSPAVTSLLHRLRDPALK